MRAALDLVVPYLRDRKQFGQPIGEFQLMQAKLADLYAACNASRAYAYAVARGCDAGRTTRFDAAACLLTASENGVRAGLEAIQALGGNGYINDFAAGRLLRDAKLYDIGAGTNEIRRMLIGREILRATA
jgi:isovaleryl-CoA dehydrogenase